MSDERPKRMSDEGFEATVNRLADIPLPGGVSVAGVSPSDVLLHFTLEARRARASEKRLAEAWKQFLSAQQTIDQAGFMDNYTDAHRARESQAKAMDRARAALSEAGHE